MSTAEVERFLIAGGSDESIKMKYDTLEPKSAFVAAANEDGYEFSEDELNKVLNENGDDFESFGNPRKRAIWWR